MEEKTHICFYATPFGVVPIELDEVYPLCQHETPLPPDQETVQFTAKQVERYIEDTHYHRVILAYNPEDWNKTILNSAREACKEENIPFTPVSIEDLTSLNHILGENT